MIHFTGDTHFSDPRVLPLDKRPFANMDEHDAALIRDWSDAVGHQEARRLDGGGDRLDITSYHLLTHPRLNNNL